MSGEGDGIGHDSGGGAGRGEAWLGTPLTAPSLAITLTEAGTEGVPPTLEVSDGEGTPIVISGEQIGVFLTQHAQARLVCEAVGRFVQVLDRFLRRGESEGSTEGRRCLWEAVRSGRLHDVGLADRVLRRRLGGLPLVT